MFEPQAVAAVHALRVVNPQTVSGVVLPAEAASTSGGDGISGPQGATGPKGDKGDTGDKGETGLTGPQGPIGLTGATGADGAKGDKGDTGTKGDTGLTGAIGVMGLQGLQGTQGIQGLTGDTGATGDKGDTGDVGPKGDTGEQGVQGLQGIQGLTGLTGDTGAKGDQGDQGLQGLQGLTGETGTKGDKGDTGLTGPQGPIGLTGLTGEQGIQGLTGATGSVGTLTLGIGLTGDITGGNLTLNFNSANISQWTNDSGFITDGNTGWDNSYSFITSADDTVSGLELDGVFSTTGLLVRTEAATYSTITNNSNNWDTAFAHSSATTNVHGLTFTAEGTGGGLDADLLDGQHASAFLTTETDTLANVTTRGAITSTGLTLNGGITTTTSTALTLDSGTTGGILIGTGANAKIITIGNTIDATAVNINSGAGNINFGIGGTASSGKVQIGASGTATPDLLVLDNGTADPTGVNGGMYYNTDTNKFRCYQNSAWVDCVGAGSGIGLDLQHAALYDTDQAMTNIPTGGTQVVLGTISVTPGNATGDVYVAGWADVYSSNGTNQPFNLVIETTNNCTGSIVGNASVTYTITTVASEVNDRGSIRISGIAIDPGASAQPYSLCAAISSGAGDSDVLNWGIEAIVIDTGADLAEIYTTNDASIEEGDVVSLDSSLQTGMKKSQIAYDRDVLGIVSTRPGLIIGGVDKEGVKAMPVALSGRVPVKVSGENGKIVVGDSLTTSSIPGIAMKSTKPGVIIGVAMTAFEAEGTGQILAFVKNGSSVENSLSGENNDQEMDNSDVVTKINIPEYVVSLISDVFNKTVEFFGNVIMHADVKFVGRPTFNKDTAGRAIIRAGSNEVTVKFGQGYVQRPVVTISINLIDGINADELPDYAIYDLSTESFKIKLTKTTTYDLAFSWIALVTDEDNVFISPDITPNPTGVISPSIAPSPSQIVPSLNPTLAPASLPTLLPSLEVVPSLSPTIEPITITPSPKPNPTLSESTGVVTSTPVPGEQ